MTKMLNLTWSRPRYVQEEILPFIPDEGELDQLIAACRSPRMAVYLQTLKEVFADPTETLRLRWIDVSGYVITINYPVKGHQPRTLDISNKLLAMTNALPKTSDVSSLTTTDPCVLRPSKSRKELPRRRRTRGF